MDRKLKIDTKSIKKTIDRTPEDYEPEIEKISYRKGITRTLVLLIGNFIGLVALVPLNIGISVDSMFTGAIVIIFISLINSFLWPIVSRVLMPFLLVTFGVGSFILNALLLKFLTWMIPGFTASGYSLFFTPLLMAIITTALSEILAVDDNSTYYRSFTKDALKRREDHVKRKKGMIILEIDGLAREILEENRMGNRLVKPDRSEPGRNTAWKQHGHSCLQMGRQEKQEQSNELRKLQRCCFNGEEDI